MSANEYLIDASTRREALGSSSFPMHGVHDERTTRKS